MRLGTVWKAVKLGAFVLAGGAIAKYLVRTKPLFTCPTCGKQVTDLSDAWAPGGGVGVWYHLRCKPLGVQPSGEA